MLSVTLKTHQSNNKQYININSIPFGSSIQTILDNYNQNRLPNTQILKLYNSCGQEIPQKLWKIQIKENISFFIDQPVTN